MDLSGSKNISMTFQGHVEERNSEFPHLKISIPCVVQLLISFTSHLLSLDFMIIPLTADTAKEFPPEKKLRNVSVFHKVSFSLVISIAPINKQISSVTS